MITSLYETDKNERLKKKIKKDRKGNVSRKESRGKERRKKSSPLSLSRSQLEKAMLTGAKERRGTSTITKIKDRERRRERKREAEAEAA